METFVSKHRDIMLKGAAALVIGLSAILSGVFAPAEASKHQCTHIDNSTNAVIRGGVCTPAQLKKKLQENKTGDLKAIYKHYNIDTNRLIKQAKPGLIMKNGDIKVDGKVVAKNAYTMGRTKTPKSKQITINGKKYWQRTDTSNQNVSSQAVMVLFDKFGRFESAIINSCGNPVIAKATKPKPSATCDSLTAKAVTRTKYDFTAKASAKNGAKITGYTFDFGDGTKKKQSSTKISHTYKKPGTYTVKVTAHTNIGNKSGGKCQVKVTVKPEPVKIIEVCDLKSGKMVKIDEKKFDSKKHSKNPADCKPMKVCDLTTDTIVEIRKSEFDSKKHSTTLKDCKKISVCEIKTGKTITIRETEFDATKHSSPEDCKPIEVCEIESGNMTTIRKNEFDTTKHSKDPADCDAKPIEVCEIETGEIITIDERDLDGRYTTDLAKCDTPEPETPEVPEVPETPEELPETGLGSALETVAKLGILAGMIGYYAVSRRV